MIDNCLTILNISRNASAKLFILSIILLQLDKLQLDKKKNIYIKIL